MIVDFKRNRKRMTTNIMGDKEVVEEENKHLPLQQTQLQTSFKGMAASQQMI